MKTQGFKFCELPRISCLVLILLLGSLRIAFGDPVNAEQAKTAVRGWLRADHAPLQTTVGQKVKRVETFNDAKGTVLYHVVYLDPEGFVIVAADDLIEPIIAFAPHGQFDPSTTNPLGALVSRDLPGRHANIKGVHAANAQGLHLAAKNKWERLNRLDQGGPGGDSGEPMDNISDVRVAPLIQSSWDQGDSVELHNGVLVTNACYNYYTPPNEPGNVGNYVCGCVATAMAQLMRYWQWPVSGVGTASFTITVDGVSTNRNLRGGNGFGGPYDWGDMVLILTNSMIQQRQAIGALCSDAGVSVSMNYSNGSSGAYLSHAKPALTNTFYYTSAIVGGDDSSTNDIGAGLNGMVNPNLDAGCPVLFAVLGGTNRHAIVCDGYGYNLSTLYHHVNLGWSDLSTLWYNLPTIGEFTTINECVYNVWPNGTGEIISGRITDNGGDPLAGVVVTATRFSGGTYTRTSNTNGIYAVVGIPSSSTYTVSVSKSGYGFTPLTVTTGQSVDNGSTSGNQWAQDFTCVLALEYSYTTNNGNTITITQYKGPGGALTIPSTITGLPVTSLGNFAFQDSWVTSVTIPNSVTSLGLGAFNDCYSLTNVMIGNGVTSLGDEAFYGCSSLTNVTIPNSVTSLGYDAFELCTNLTSVTIGNSVTNIGYWAFWNCTSLTGVYFQGNAPYVGANVFQGDNNATVYFMPGTTGWVDGGSLDGRPTKMLIQYSYSTNSFDHTIIINKYTGPGGAVTIPSMINGLPVAHLQIKTFANCTNLTSVTIPYSVTSIGEEAFVDDYSLTGVYFQGNAPDLGSYVFLDDTNVTIYYLSGTTGWTNPAVEVTVPGYIYTATNGTITITRYTGSAGVLTITNMIGGLPVTCLGDNAGDNAFEGCTNLTSVTIPNSVTSIGQEAFCFCTGLTNVTIGTNVTSIGFEAFYVCTSLASVTIPNSVTNIGAEAFCWCTSLTSITVGTGNPTYSSVAGVLFDKSQTLLIQYPWGKGRRYTIPNSVTTIGSEAFIDDYRLTSVTIPDSVTTIEYEAFAYCTNLGSVYFGGNALSVSNDLSVFFGDTNAIVYFMPGTTGWGDSFDGLPTDCLFLAFMSPTAITILGWGVDVWPLPADCSISIPSLINGVLVTGIGDSAFAGSTNLISVTLPNSVTDIGHSAFSGCTSLISVTIPDSITRIRSNTFSCCTSLSSVTIPNSVTNIGNSAFGSCANLTSVKIGANVTHIGDGAFGSCTSLSQVYFKGNAPSLGSAVFYNDYNATVYYLPGTTGWGSWFGGCPTVLWNPQAQNLGVDTTGLEFEFTITGTSNLVVAVEACTDLVNPVWTPLQTNTLNAFVGTNGTSYFSDPLWTNFPSRFYQFTFP